jgi:hypothetical protein
LGGTRRCGLVKGGNIFHAVDNSDQGSHRPGVHTSESTTGSSAGAGYVGYAGQPELTCADCKTDVFFNTFSLLFPAIGAQFDIWWLDPLGAGLLSLFIIYDWCETCFGNVIRLSGSSVDDRLLQKVIFVAYRFESLVCGIKNVVAYHAGDGIWVEMDILLEPHEKLLRAHDIAETLQYCLEGLAEVDRAFVTVDCAYPGSDVVTNLSRYLSWSEWT